MTGVVEQDIFGFEVPINHFEPMQTLQSTKQFSSVEPRTVDIEALFPLKVMEQLTAIYEGKNQVELLRRLEGKLQGYDEGIVDLRKHRPLCKGVCDFRPRNNVSLSDRLEGVDSAGILLPIRSVTSVSVQVVSIPRE